jgi:signal transduction histidine kinase
MSTGVASAALFQAGYILSIGLAAGLAAYSYVRGSEQASDAFAAAMLAVLLWSLGAFGRLFAATETVWYAWTILMYFGVLSTTVMFFVFAALYTDRIERVGVRQMAALFALPLVSLVVLSTNPIHGLFFASLSPVEFGGMTVFFASSGPWFWVHALYSYALFGVGTALLGRFALGNREVYRKQALSVIAGTAVPWVFNVVYLFPVGPSVSVDPTPIGFAVGGGLLAYGVFRSGLTTLTPVARSTVFDAIDDAVFVADAEGRLVDLNPAAEALLAAETDPIGEGLEGLLPAAVFDADEGPHRLSADGEERWVRARQVHLEEGRVLLLTDVTAEVHRRRQLRDQNRRLEEFTKIAAHDLRNPLNAISGYTALARETGDTSDLDRVEPAIARIETLVDDLLRLGEEGQVVAETAPVSLSAAAEEAWARVDAEDATLEVAEDLQLAADETRLLSLLEQLFVNAVTHGGDRVTVRVGETADGFFVSDDGCGIPEQRRNDIFEYGYSTHSDAGLGLPIVQSIAGAHGWDVSVATDDAVGTRFEFAGAQSTTAATEAPEPPN